MFEIKLDNGQVLVAKLPYPLAGPAHFTTASEVATMQFMREMLELPVPQVLAWSSRSENTPVKSEFIIMEKLGGRYLSDAWDDLTTDETANIIQEIVEVERRMTETYFHALGSLYYIKDIPDNVRSIGLSSYSEVADKLYCIGPTVERRFWCNGRAELNINRGPCELNLKINSYILITQDVLLLYYQGMISRNVLNLSLIVKSLG